MTFKNIFNKLGFSTFIEADFCVVLRKDDCYYALYNDGDLKCISLYDFTEKGIDELAYEYTIDCFGIIDENEEYVFTDCRGKSEVINFIFNLKNINNEELNDSTGITNFFDGIYKFQGENKLSLLLHDRKGKVRNALLFDENSYRLLLGNRQCFWSKGEGRTAVIAYNPFSLYSYYSGNHPENYTFFLFPLGYNLQNNFIPSGRIFEVYSFLCGRIDEWVEALRTIFSYLRITYKEHITYTVVGNKCIIEFIINEDTEILPYLNIANKCLKRLREFYLRDDFLIKTFFLEKREIPEGKIISITFTRNIQEVEIIADYFIKRYTLPFTFESY